MANAITAQPTVLKQILVALRRLQIDVAEVKEKLETAPPYGSEEWWQWSIKKSEEDFKAGRYKSFSSVEELQKHLNSLKLGSTDLHLALRTI